MAQIGISWQQVYVTVDVGVNWNTFLKENKTMSQSLSPWNSCSVIWNYQHDDDDDDDDDDNDDDSGGGNSCPFLIHSMLIKQGGDAIINKWIQVKSLGMRMEEMEV